MAEFMQCTSVLLLLTIFYVTVLPQIEYVVAWVQERLRKLGS